MKKKLVIQALALAASLVPNNVQTSGWNKIITVHNTFSHPVWIAPYYLTHKESKRVDSQICVLGENSVKLIRPTAQLGAHRHLVAAPAESMLLKKMSLSTWERQATHSIGGLSGSTFYVDTDHLGTIKIFDEAEWHTNKQHKAVIRSILHQSYNARHRAEVLTGPHYWNIEDAYLARRLPALCTNIQKITGQHVTPQNVPRIALCSSGGGFRAMLSTAGLLRGAQATGLYDAFSHIATVSGSTWTLSSMLAHQFSAEQLCTFFLSHVNAGIVKPSKEVFKALSTNKIVAELFGKRTGPIDLYGTFLAQTLLDPIESSYDQTNLTHESIDDLPPTWSQLTLSDLAKTTKPEQTPFTFFTAVSPQGNGSYFWLEFSPHDVKSDHLNSAIPSWALDRDFHAGTATQFTPEPSLGYLMGAFGSSFTGTINAAIKQLFSLMTSYIPESWQSFAFNGNWANTHIMAAQVANFSRGCHWSPERHADKLPAVDSGYQANIPLEPLLHEHRGIDMIIVLDCKRESHKYATVLKKAVDKALAAGYKLPPIDFEKARTQPFCVFKDENDATCPIIVYLPLRPDTEYDATFSPATSDFCSTFNFRYTPEQAGKLMGLTEFTFLKYAPAIKKEIEYLVDRRSK